MSNWQTANAAVSLFAAAVLTIVILHPKIQEGLTIKAGLMAMVLGLLATAALTASQSVAWDAYWRAGFAVRAGLALVCLGVIHRARVHARHRDGQHPPIDYQLAMTRSWLRRIAEPVHDLAHLLSSSPETDPQSRKDQNGSAHR